MLTYRKIALAGVAIVAIAIGIWAIRRTEQKNAGADSSVGVNNNGTIINNTATATFTSEGSNTVESVVSNNTQAVNKSGSGTSQTKIKGKASNAIVLLPVDKNKSYIRLDGQNIPADDSSVYRVVVGVISTDGSIITDRKPKIIASGGDTTIKGPDLVGNEWFTRIASKDPGDRTVDIMVDNQDFGQLKMTFVSKDQTDKKEIAPSVQVPIPAPSEDQNITGQDGIPARKLTFLQALQFVITQFYNQLTDGVKGYWGDWFSK